MTNCPNCSAPLNGTGRCEYCGTFFREERLIVRMNVSHPDRERLIDLLIRESVPASLAIERMLNI